jgi:hypothetical protein
MHDIHWPMLNILYHGENLKAQQPSKILEGRNFAKIIYIDQLRKINYILEKSQSTSISY